MKKQIISFIILVLLPMVASAEAVEIDGIYYYLIPKGKVAEVTSNPNKYTGAVEIPEAVTYNDVIYNVTSIGQNAFHFCDGLTSVNIPNSITAIGDNAFENSLDLTTVNIPPSVVLIGSYAFSRCMSLTSIILPNSVKTIRSGAFQECYALTAVNIPDSVNTIEYATFYRCPELLDVYCFAENVPSTDASAFNDSYIEYVTLHVPASAINDYKATAPWSGFKEVVPIEEVTLEKCATPAIAYANDELTFSCETEDVEFVYDVKVNGATSGTGNKVKVATTLTVNVYAKKEGYENSDVATKEIQPKFGDLSGDGKVDATDLTKLIEILLKR